MKHHGVVNQSSSNGLRELALFAGAGGGILGGQLLGWRTVCAVEIEPYPAAVLVARQNDKTFEPFPIWNDIRTFDGYQWRGRVDVVSGGFPCQDISSAGKGKGLAGERSGLWSEMARIIGEVQPRYVFIENSPMLVKRGLSTVLSDLAKMGYDAEWICLSARECGAPHKRERIWIVAVRSSSSVDHTNQNASWTSNRKIADKTRKVPSINWKDGHSTRRIRSTSSYQPRSTMQRLPINEPVIFDYRTSGGQYCLEEWTAEPCVDRMVDGMANQSHRIAALGNGQVPRVAATAWLILEDRLKLDSLSF